MADGDVLRANTGDELAETDVICRCGCRCRWMGGSGRKGCFDDTALLLAGDPLGGSRNGDESCEGGGIASSTPSSPKGLVDDETGNLRYSTY